MTFHGKQVLIGLGMALALSAAAMASPIALAGHFPGTPAFNFTLPAVAAPAAPAATEFSLLRGSGTALIMRLAAGHSLAFAAMQGTHPGLGPLISAMHSSGHSAVIRSRRIIVVIPEPATLALMGSGMLALGILLRRRYRLGIPRSAAML